MKQRVIDLIFNAKLDSWLRDIATLIGSVLTGHGFSTTGSNVEVLTGALLLAYGFFTKFIDLADGPGQGWGRFVTLLIGPRVQSLASSSARWLLLTLAGFAKGVGFEVPGGEEAILSSDVVTTIYLALTFVAQRYLKPFVLKQ